MFWFDNHVIEALGMEEQQKVAAAAAAADADQHSMSENEAPLHTMVCFFFTHGHANRIIFLF